MCILSGMQYPEAGQALTEWMERDGRTPRELAPKIGAGRTMIYQYKAGETRPELGVAIALEDESGGDVAIGLWGYSDEIVVRMRGVVARRASAEQAA